MLSSPGRQDITLDPQSTALLIIDMNLWCTSPEIGASVLLSQVPTVEFDYYYNRVQETVVPTIENLSKTCRANKIPVYYSIVGTKYDDLKDWSPGLRISDLGAAIVSSQPGNPEYDIPEAILPKPADVVFHKPGSSCFMCTNLDHQLKSAGIKNLILTGVLTNCCVYNTAITASELGYKLTVLEDCCAALSKNEHEVYLNSAVASIFFHVNSSDEVLNEINQS